MMGNYSKLWGAIVGNVVGAFVAWMAYAGLASCEDLTVLDTCTVFGLSQGQMTAAILGVINSVTVFWFPANKP